MPPIVDATSLLDQEARALLTRVQRLRPLVLHETLVPAAGFEPAALAAVEVFLAEGRAELHQRIQGYLAWLHGPGRAAPAAVKQRRFVLIRLRFNHLITRFDTFYDVLTQRSEQPIGLWLSGLDVAAADGLRLPDRGRPPAVVCYLDRGPGAAIRRARTRLAGGAAMPVSVVRVPRERMIGFGVGSSLYHEVGHQAAALLDLVPSLTPVIDARRRQATGTDAVAWGLLQRWISEIVADLWSVGHLGLSSTLGLIAVVSLPRRFVFRIRTDDPHPAPYVRVKLSAALGAGIIPHPQWARLRATWQALYPTAGLDAATRRRLTALDRVTPEFVRLVLTHRPPKLGGRALHQALPMAGRPPEQLLDLWRAWRGHVPTIARQRPSLALAVVGQARLAGQVSTATETQLLERLLVAWAVHDSLTAARAAARITRRGGMSPADARPTPAPRQLVTTTPSPAHRT